MASITKDSAGKQRIQFVALDGNRKTIYLGKIARRAAEAIKVRVERIAAAKESGCGLDRETAQWVADLDTKLAGKLSRVGLIDSPEHKAMPKLLEHLDRYFATRTDVKESTLTHWRQARGSLLDFFGADRLLDTITQGDAKDFERWLKTPAARRNNYSGKSKGLAPNTVRKRCGDSKQFFADAVEREILPRNPFAGISSTVTGNLERQHFIDRDTVAKVISACPDFEWRALLALARFGGLRNPSETLELCWGDINWETGRMTVRSKKTEHHEGKGSRVVPIFPELRPFLEEAWELAGPGQKYVISRYRGNVNLRTQLQKIIKRAGVAPWPKLWQNLRSSRATELASACPAHVATAFLGHSIQVAQKHYWQVTDADFEKATQNTTQQAHAEGSLGSQAALEENTETSVLPEDSAQCVALLNQAVGDEGLEQRLHFPTKSNNGPLRDAEYDARCADSGVIDPDLEGLIRAWPNLSESVRKEILKHLPSPSSRQQRQTQEG